MECNKEEAVRAKEMAERKMLSKDFIGARKMALKAQQLFPELENISHMLSVCEIHCSAELRTCGTDMDWYRILQVEVSADEGTIKKQFRKLALLLHPDKNKFPGAEAAFKLIGEAQRVLLDPRKRVEHNMRRRIGLQTAIGGQHRPPPTKNSHIGSQTVAKGNIVNQTGHQNHFMNHTHHLGVTQQQQALDAFWTACPFCNIRYRYYRNILNRTLRCQNCMKYFVAYDLDAQGESPGFSPGYRPAAPVQRDVPSQGPQKVGPQTDAQPQVNVGVGTGSVPVEIATQGMGTDSEIKNKVAEDVKKAGVDHGAHVAKAEKGPNKKRRKAVVESSESSYSSGSVSEEVDDIKTKNVKVGETAYPRRSNRHKKQVGYTEGESEDDLVTSSSSKKVTNITKSNEASPADSVGYNQPSEKEQHLSSAGVPDGNKHRENDESEKDQGEPRDKGEGATSKLSLDDDSDEEGLHYPEPEFYDFDQDRTENMFHPNQVWALYDTREGMPRFYARIKKVSLPKFRLQFTWLEANPTDKDEMAWNEEELPIACGVFKHGDVETTETIAMFSHLVSWEKATGRGTYRILPRKGDVWALFKDWDISWCSDPEKHIKYEFEIVEVLSDFIEGTGVKVARLFKVKGFTSLFQRMAVEGTASFQIQSKELLRFSHRIPSYRMTGKEKKGIPEQSLELDPASVPTGLQEYEPSVSYKEDIDALDAKENDACIKSSFEEKKHSTECGGVSRKRELKDKHLQEKENRGLKASSPQRTKGAKEKRPILGDESPSGPRKRTVSDCTIPENKRSCQMNGSMHHFGMKDGEIDPDPSSSDNIGDTFILPDSEFHNFETDKSMDRFEKGQFWAVYSEEDGMPKYFARIERVDEKSLQVQARWFECCPMSEEEKRWAKKGLPYGCGTFKLRRQIEDIAARTFSHQIHPLPKSKKGWFDVCPRKDEVWAVYKNWKLGWSPEALDDCEIDIVQVLGDTGQVFEVQYLRKVNGYRSVFERLASKGEISKTELLRFSHQIPAFYLTEERGGKLRGYLELDAASLPTHLLCQTST